MNYHVFHIFFDNEKSDFFEFYVVIRYSTVGTCDIEEYWCYINFDGQYMNSIVFLLSKSWWYLYIIINYIEIPPLLKF